MRNFEFINDAIKDPYFIERFYAQIEKGEKCWPWIGRRFRNYGYVTYRASTFRAHRVAYAIAHGGIGDVCVLHKCDNPPCCNPDCLFEGTQLDNIRDMVAKGRGRTGEVQAKLTHDEVRAIRAIGHTVPYTETGKRFGVWDSTVRDIVRGKSWRHVT